MSGRYDASENVEAQFEPGSDGRVLANKLGVTDPGEMDDIELDLLAQLYDIVVDGVAEDQRMSAPDLCEWHRRWLGIHSGLDDYAPMIRLVRRALRESLRREDG